VRGKNICVLGFAFKKDTGDFRDSAAIDVVQLLVAEKANVFVYDPKVSAVEINKMFPTVTCEKSPYAAAYQSHAVVIITEWDEFRTLDYARIYSSMAKPAFVFDGRNILDHHALGKLGFKVYAVGKCYPQYCA
jgi:UDPglucose 6-dehydrogenase